MVHAAASALCAAAALAAPLAGAFVPSSLGASPPSSSLAAHREPFFCEALSSQDHGTTPTPTKAKAKAAGYGAAFAWHRPFLDASRAYSAIATALESTPLETDATIVDEPAMPPPPGKSKTQFAVPRSLGIVAENADSVQFAAGTLGSVLGFAVGGPFLGVLLGCGANYLARKGDDAGQAGEVVESASAKVLAAYNGVAKSEGVNGALDSAIGFLEGAVDKAKDSEGGAGDALTSIGNVWGTVAEKIDEFDLVGGAQSALGAVGDLVETGLDKVAGLNEEYKLTDRVVDVTKSAASQVNKFE